MKEKDRYHRGRPDSRRPRPTPTDAAAEDAEDFIPADGTVDGDTGEIISIRVIGLPHEFSLALRNTLETIKNQRINYPLAIQALYRMSTEEMAERATIRCSI